MLKNYKVSQELQIGSKPKPSMMELKELSNKINKWKNNLSLAEDNLPSEEWLDCKLSMNNKWKCGKTNSETKESPSSKTNYDHIF